MKRLLPLVALLALACDREPEADLSAEAPSASVLTNSEDARKSKIPSVVPKPADETELDRMILAGYTPHADHLHAPGVKSCPLAQGAEAVM